MPDYCTIALENCSFAVAVEDLREVIEPLPITPVPLAPPGVRGVVNLRGDLVPVLMPEAALGLPDADDSAARRPWMAVFRQGALSFGLLVNGVGTVREREPEPLPEGQPAAALMEGAIATANAKLPILNLRAIAKHLEEGLKRSAQL